MFWPRRPARACALALATFIVGACERAPEPVDPQRISLEDARQRTGEPLASPDTSKATWKVSANGQSIDFGDDGGSPMLTLACRLRENPPEMRIIRHVRARPGQKALFPVLGNGMISRFLLDAQLNDGEWRWEGGLPASDPQLEVFTGPRDLEATLPGGGTLAIAGSRIPGEFINWCRAGGRMLRVEAAENQAAEEEAQEAAATDANAN